MNTSKRLGVVRLNGQHLATQEVDVFTQNVDPGVTIIGT